MAQCELDVETDAVCSNAESTIADCIILERQKLNLPPSDEQMTPSGEPVTPNENSPEGQPSQSAMSSEPPPEQHVGDASRQAGEGVESLTDNMAAMDIDAEETSASSSSGTANVSAVRPRDESYLSAGMDDFYNVKWIRYLGQSVPIVTQNENGPCPLIAIANVLLLRRTIKLPPNTDIITGQQLIAAISDHLISSPPKNMSEGDLRNYEQNINDAFMIFPTLKTGLDVNVRFTGVGHFEYTSALCVFDLFVIHLYHGWLVDPQEGDINEVVGDSSYNQLVEKIINYKADDNPETVNKGLLAENFLEHTASQLTYHGLCELTSTVKENQLAVLFRNNHFSTIFKKTDRLFVLVTDMGLLNEPRIVWEVLNDVDGDTQFVDSDFSVYVASDTSSPPSASASPASAEARRSECVGSGTQQEGNNQLYGAGSSQVLSDYELAVALHDEQMRSIVPNQDQDLELARRLQEEEERLVREDAQAADALQRQGAHGGRGSGPPPAAQRRSAGSQPAPSAGTQSSPSSRQNQESNETKGSGCTLS